MKRYYTKLNSPFTYGEYIEAENKYFNNYSNGRIIKTIEVCKDCANDKNVYSEIYEEQIEAKVKSKLENLFLSKSKDLISEKCYKEMLDEVIDAHIYLEVYTKEEEKEHPWMRNYFNVCYGERDYNRDMIEITTEQMFKKLVDLFGTKEIIFEAGYCYNESKKLENRIKRIIKRMLREDYKYCLKKDKIVVPEENLGSIEDIKAWSSKKTSNNKNNSLEKTIMRESLKEKKERGRKIFEHLIWRVEENNRKSYDKYWGVCHVCLGNTGNSAIKSKTANEVLFNGKTSVEIMNMTDDDFINLTKKYLQDLTAKMTNAILEAEFEEIEFFL